MPSKIVAERKRRAAEEGTGGSRLVVNANSGVVHLAGCPMIPGRTNALGWKPADAQPGDKGCILCFNGNLPTDPTEETP